MKRCTPAVTISDLWRVTARDLQFAWLSIWHWGNLSSFPVREPAKNRNIIHRSQIQRGHKFSTQFINYFQQSWKSDQQISLNNTFALRLAHFDADLFSVALEGYRERQCFQFNSSDLIDIRRLKRSNRHSLSLSFRTSKTNQMDDKVTRNRMIFGKRKEMKWSKNKLIRNMRWGARTLQVSFSWEMREFSNDCVGHWLSGSVCNGCFVVVLLMTVIELISRCSGCCFCRCVCVCVCVCVSNELLNWN